MTSFARTRRCKRRSKTRGLALGAIRSTSRVKGSVFWLSKVPHKSKSLLQADPRSPRRAPAGRAATMTEEARGAAPQGSRGSGARVPRGVAVALPLQRGVKTATSVLGRSKIQGRDAPCSATLRRPLRKRSMRAASFSCCELARPGRCSSIRIATSAANPASAACAPLMKRRDCRLLGDKAIQTMLWTVGIPEASQSSREL